MSLRRDTLESVKDKTPARKDSKMKTRISSTDFAEDAAFASDFGWRPGQCPRVIFVDGNEYSARYVDSSDGEVWSVKYGHGTRFLTVYND